MMPKLRYGRGKFTHHQDYIAYQLMIARHPHYKGMPGAFNDEGKPVWQVSSGKTTSFYEFYKARQEWWTDTAHSLGLPGRGKENDRWTVAARTIHPTGYRRCLICGQDKNIGYFYVNKPLLQRLLKHDGLEKLTFRAPITDALKLLAAAFTAAAVAALIHDLFPEREKYFKTYGFTKTAFEKSQSLKSPWLSPGFMGDPPYRFDGLHDYCTDCRKKNDPGRSDENMRTYIHDRRAFQWWAEGDWALADALYRAAAGGQCVRCKRVVKKLTPDHIGPLSCGFKHVPFFRPLCNACNSQKNRRMTRRDVTDLIDYEEATISSAASWQVRALWNRLKLGISTREQAAELSALMRSMEDVFFRLLNTLYENDQVRFLRSLLHPEYALWKHEFVDLDASRFTFSDVTVADEDTPNRRSLAARSIRIAFDEMLIYAEKHVSQRRMRASLNVNLKTITTELTTLCQGVSLTKQDLAWVRAVKETRGRDAREAEILALLESEGFTDTHHQKGDEAIRKYLEGSLGAIAASVSL